MSDPKRPLSEWSRQELLDEIYYLRDVAGERDLLLRRQHPNYEAGERAIAELDRILHSRSWQLTAPMRWLARALRRERRSATAGAVTSGLPARSAEGRETGRESRPESTLVPEPAVSEVRKAGDKRLYIDVTEAALHEGRTGVQRVTHEILRALLTAPPDGYVVRPLYALSGQPYRVAARFAARLRGIEAADDVDVLVDARAGDVFLGLDHAMETVAERLRELEAMRRHDVQIWFVCHDTLPLDHPEWFPAEVPPRFEQWLRTVLRVADGVACNSRSTEAGVSRWLDGWEVPRDKPLRLGHFGLGATMGGSASKDGLTNNETSGLPEGLAGKTVFLMVGTLEPRKGHAQALEAFNRLWANGEDVALVIAGLPGWMTEVTQRRIRHHEEIGKRLFWFMEASDALLEKLYATCTVLLAPSEGEGFGLPLVEAARHGLPILCRDLPVFREIAGPHATYFAGCGPDSLASAILSWMDAWRQGKVQDSHGLHCLSWAESARELASLVLGTTAAASPAPNGGATIPPQSRP